MHSTIILMGNPGSGKSTLLSSLVEGTAVFPSGPAIGSGKTSELQRVEHKGNTYVDTPGLSDVKLRDKAAKEIQNALMLGGNFKLFFVVTLESGRVRPDDVATIKLVLDALPSVAPDQYSIIINKLSSQFEELLNKEKDGKEELAVYLTPPSMKTGTRSIFYVPLNNEWADATNKWGPLLNLQSFIENAPGIEITAERVREIQYLQFETIVEDLRKEIQQLREDNEAMRREIAQRDAMLANLVQQVPLDNPSNIPIVSSSSSSRSRPRAIFIGDYGAEEATVFESLESSVQLSSINKGKTKGVTNSDGRKKAAEVIEHALQGRLQLFFIVTLEFESINADDLATIKVVLQAAQIHDQYSIIINTSKEADYLINSGADWKDFANSLISTSIKDCTKSIFYVDPTWNNNPSQLDQELRNFILAAPETTIAKNQMKPIKHKDYRKIIKQKSKDEQGRLQSIIDRIRKLLKMLPISRERSTII